MSTGNSLEYDQTSGSNTSLWLEEKSLPFNPLNEDSQTEVCIIGAGMAGLSVAYHLIKAGKKVVVIEARQIGSGETGRTTAHISNAFDDRYYELDKVHGEEITYLVGQSHSQAIQTIEEIVKAENIDCDFERVDGYLFLDPTTSKDILHKECVAAKKAGLSGVNFVTSCSIKGFPSQPVLHFPDQGQFHSIKYLNGLAKFIIKNGGKIYTETEALDVKPGKTIKIKTNNKCNVSAKKLVIATNAPIFDKSLSFAKQASYRSFVIVGLIPKDSLKHALYWDTADPYHYVRLQTYNNNSDLVIIGGEDHRTGKKIDEKNDPFTKLEAWARQLLPAFGEIVYKWSGQVQEPTDHLAYIGQLDTEENNIYIATGDSGNGITHGAIAGMLISDLILEKKNRWTKAYNPNRTFFKNFKELLQHNLISVGSYLGYLTPGEASELDSILPGEGKIVRRGLHKIAVYRDDEGNLCERSAACTHMNAPLEWNPIEKSWDCPAHGSRFAPCGRVVQGPASCPLKKL